MAAARHGRRGEGARRHDGAIPFGRREAVDLLAADLDQRVIFERPRHICGEAFPVDREHKIEILGEGPPDRHFGGRL